MLFSGKQVKKSHNLEVISENIEKLKEYWQDENMVRKHIIFYGRVQGVGFRYYAVNKARSLGLTGWVENLYNGNVEMEVQGAEKDIQELLDYLSCRKYVMITGMESEEISLKREHGFRER